MGQVSATTLHNAKERESAIQKENAPEEVGANLFNLTHSALLMKLKMKWAQTDVQKIMNAVEQESALQVAGALETPNALLKPSHNSVLLTKPTM